MEQLQGKTILKKIAIGKVFYFEKTIAEVRRQKIEDTVAEIIRFERAKETAQEQLQGLYEKAKEEVGEAEADIFQVHSMMLDDDDFCDTIINYIHAGNLNAEYAVAKAGDEFAEMFASMDDEYMKARSADIKDISERLLCLLSGVQRDGPTLTEPVILIADDLSPSETVQMDKSNILAFVTRAGSVNSHTAILARSMDIPALIEVKIDKAWHGRMAVVDGYQGTIVIDPDAVYLEELRGIQERDKQKAEAQKALIGQKSMTKSGKEINVYANIGTVSDVAFVLQQDGEGIGLFRSEFLYLESKALPTEEEQFLAYKEVAEKMEGKPVIIRTLDIGADKQVDYLDLAEEENPALGYRAIRICLTQTEIFKTQLRAIYRASAFGEIAIMFPMIISVEELAQIKVILESVKIGLSEQGIPYGDPQIGVMIETPAAVMVSEELAQEVDFFSIGTNDLTQYTLAIDRQNPKLDHFYDAHHPAILKMIQMTIENGHKGGAWVGICGELAADLELTEQFVEMGVDELSVSPPFILSLREKIRGLE
ncbi:MAG: phosphoenolpyruvate--protein phosphotransferase [Lachnospiraceae bacterium]|nr:phosphoenolpyruvate--protein phosphotransferase [Lachnospiraceae bacterium]